jgi:hypothetical protein
MPFPPLPAKTMKNQGDANPDGANPPIAITGYWNHRKYTKPPIRHPTEKLVIQITYPITHHEIRIQSSLIDSTCIKLKMHGM